MSERRKVRGIAAWTTQRHLWARLRRRFTVKAKENELKNLCRKSVSPQTLHSPSSELTCATTSFSRASNLLVRVMPTAELAPPPELLLPVSFAAVTSRVVNWYQSGVFMAVAACHIECASSPVAQAHKRADSVSSRVTLAQSNAQWKAAAWKLTRSA